MQTTVQNDHPGEKIIPLPQSLSPAMTNLTPTNLDLDWPLVSVIIPTLNEAKNLPHILPAIPRWVHEVIIVDGRSTDDTVAVAQQLRPGVRIIMEQKKGKGAALRRGFAEARGEIIVMLDADGSMHPREMYSYVGALVAGADFAKGSRFLQGGGTDDMEWLRYMGNLGLTTLTKLLFGSLYSDLCYGYSAFWKRVLPRLDLQSDGFEIETEMNIRALRARLKITEVPSFEANRIHGTSNLNTWRDGWRVLRKIMSEFVEHRIKRSTLPPEAPLVKEDVDPLIPAMKLLSMEARHLNFIRHQMTAEAYYNAIDAIKEACWVLLQAYPDHPDMKMVPLPKQHSDLDIHTLFAKQKERTQQVS
jgi:glycosyltransferase involved in cell wall biosynthesis